MPDYDARFGGLSITDFPKHDQIANWVEAAIRSCAEEEGKDLLERTQLVVGDMFVFGSYARDQAVKGESDLDVIVEVQNKRGEELDPDFDSLRRRVEMCAEDYLEDYVDENWDEWFAGADFMTMIPQNKEQSMIRVTTDSRMMVKGRQRIYNLREGVFVYRDRI